MANVVKVRGRELEDEIGKLEGATSLEPCNSREGLEIVF